MLMTTMAEAFDGILRGTRRDSLTVMTLDGCHRSWPCGINENGSPYWAEVTGVHFETPVCAFFCRKHSLLRNFLHFTRCLPLCRFRNWSSLEVFTVRAHATSFKIFLQISAERNMTRGGNRFEVSR